VVSTLAGNGKPGTSDGAGLSAQFNNPSGLAVDGAGNLFVTESKNHRIRKITPDGTVKTFAGSLTPGFADGVGSAAQFNLPDGIVTDPAENLYVTEAGNHAVRKISPDGSVTTLAGNGKPGFVDGDQSMAQFNQPQGIGWDTHGNLVVADTGNHSIRLLQLLALPRIVTPPQGQIVTFGENVKFAVIVDGTGSFVFQWLFNGTALRGQTNPDLNLSGVKVSDAGAYSVRISNAAGSVTSQPASLVVIKGTPIITWNKPGDITAGTALGDAQLNATANIPGEFFFTPSSGVVLAAGDNQILSTVFVPSDLNNYTKASATVTLNVKSAPLPIITAQPVSVIVPNGAVVTFSVTATNATTYQWRKEAVNLAGATNSSLTINNVSAAEVGTYSALVGNAAGSVTSNPATLKLTQSEPVLRVEAVGLSPTGFQLRLSTSAVSSYVIQASADLSSWTSIFTNSAPGAADLFLDTEAGKLSRRFYRLKLP
jgi:hypothetical protein